MALLSATGVSAKLVTYPAPSEAKLNDAFKVEISQNGGSWVGVDSYNVMVDEVIDGKHLVRNTSMAYFDFSETVNVRVISKAGINSVRVRPLAYGIAHETKGDTILFQLDRPRQLSVEVNGDIFNNLQLFANPLETEAPANPKKWAKKKGHRYFGPGYHKLDGVLTIGSNEEVYVAGGAYVDGVIEITDARNARLFGRGMIYPEKRMGVHVRNGRNVEVDGIFTTQCAVGGSDSVRINNVKVMSYYGWGDGFNVFASDNVHYTNVFARTSDDCTTVYATRKGFVGGAENISMENSVLWADVAHPIMIGIHGSAKEIGPDAAPDTIRNVVYRNIEILDQKEPQLDYQGALTINAGDNNIVRDITFENINVESLRQGRLLDLRIFYNTKYCGAPGLAIENIDFKNVKFDGDNSELSLIIGYDETRKVKGIHFTDLSINGRLIYDDMPGKPKWYKTGDMARIFIGEHVEDVTFDVSR